MNTIQKNIFILALALLCAAPAPVSAASAAVTPAVVDLKAHARDIEKESLTIKNTSGRILEVYPFVYDIAPESGARTFLDPSLADASHSLANWIQLSRASILLKAGETKEVPYEVDVNLSAEPAVYHAVIVFARGSTRSEAEQNLASGASADINLEVLSDAKERLQLNMFGPTRALWLAAPVRFSYTLENVGNRSETPTGEVRIYNGKGEEIGTVPLNPKNEEILPDATTVASATWGGPESSWLADLLWIRGFGKYKAMLDIQYGPSGAQTLQDTATFWVVPLVPSALLIGGIVFLFFFVRPMIHRRPRNELK